MRLGSISKCANCFFRSYVMVFQKNPLLVQNSSDYLLHVNILFWFPWDEESQATTQYNSKEPEPHTSILGLVFKETEVNTNDIL
jgi:hypothetical protein